MKRDIVLSRNLSGLCECFYRYLHALPVIYVVKVALCALINLSKPRKYVEPKVRCVLNACSLYTRYFFSSLAFHWPL